MEVGKDIVRWAAWQRSNSLRKSEREEERERKKEYERERDSGMERRRV